MTPTMTHTQRDPWQTVQAIPREHLCGGVKLLLHIFVQTSSAQINLLLWLFRSLYCILIFWSHNMLTSDSLLCTRGFFLHPADDLSFPSTEKTNA